ncbi:MAG: hypothetical protein ACI8RA_001555 [Chlamydiales bacterium]|jgi:hypothetical protein
MRGVKEFCREHKTLCVCTFGLAAVGYMGAYAFNQVLEKTGLVKRVDDVAQERLLPKESRCWPESLSNLQNLLPARWRREKKLPPFKCHYVLQPFNLLFGKSEALRDEFAKMKQELRLLEDYGIKLLFDDESFSISIGNSSHEVLRALSLADKHYLTQLFFRGPTVAYSIFNGYVSSLQVLKRTMPPKKLLAEAEVFFEEYQKSPLAPHPYDAEIDSIPKDLGIAEYFGALIEKVPGICIGESHEDPEPKKMLIENMDYLRESGVKTIFLEHLFYDSPMQEMLDQYCKNKENEMPPLLCEHLKSLDEGFLLATSRYNFTRLVEAAKKEGIRVVGLDTVASYECGFSARAGAQGGDRFLGMNYVAQEIMKKEKGKFVALMGEAHGTKAEGIPGIPEVTGYPSLWVRSSSKDCIKRKVSETVLGCHLEYDILMEIGR